MTIQTTATPAANQETSDAGLVMTPEATNPTKHSPESANAELVAAFSSIISWFQRHEDLTPEELANYKDSPVRAAKALAEMTATRTEISETLREVLATGFPVNGKGTRDIVTQGVITTTSYCPHHLLPVLVETVVSYLPSPGGTVLGLSKLARVVETLSKRPVLQEQLAEDIVDVLSGMSAEFPHGQEANVPDAATLHEDTKPAEPVPYKTPRFPYIKTAGAAVHISGIHLCMACRGVGMKAATVVTATRGAFRDANMEMRFNQAVQHLYFTSRRG